MYSSNVSISSFVFAIDKYFAYCQNNFSTMVKGYET